jgi:peptidase M42 family hydrolase
VREPDRAIAAHLDTLGTMVTHIKANGRLKLTPLGSWSARFAEGARVTILSRGNSYRGSILPLRSSGHVFGDSVDELPIGWEYVELRVDANCNSAQQAHDLGICVGDVVAVDPNPEFLPSGHIVSRHLDDKAGVACLLTAIRAVRMQTKILPVECHPIFTLAEEEGCAAGHAPDQDVGEFISIDIGPVSEEQNSSEHAANICMKDTSGSYDSTLTSQLIDICTSTQIDYRTDVYRYYRSDTNSAVVAGNDLRHALIAFGAESTHGYERTHIDSLLAVTKLLAHYMLSD